MLHTVGQCSDHRRREGALGFPCVCLCIVWVECACADYYLCSGTLATCYHAPLHFSKQVRITYRVSRKQYQLKLSLMAWTEDIYPQFQPYDPNAFQILPVSVQCFHSLVCSWWCDQLKLLIIATINLLRFV